jgi:hypothetical protein
MEANQRNLRVPQYGLWHTICRNLVLQTQGRQREWGRGMGLGCGMTKPNCSSGHLFNAENLQAGGLCNIRGDRGELVACQVEVRQVAAANSSGDAPTWVGTKGRATWPSDGKKQVKGLNGVRPWISVPYLILACIEHVKLFQRKDVIWQGLYLR